MCFTRPAELGAGILLDSNSARVASLAIAEPTRAPVSRRSNMHTAYPDDDLHDGLCRRESGSYGNAR
jgi:hypothetical protein